MPKQKLKELDHPSNNQCRTAHMQCRMQVFNEYQEKVKKYY